MGGGVCTTLRERDYQRAIEVFYRHDTHPQQVARFVKDQVLPYLSPAEERSCLDVGCGPGLVTRLLSRDFHHVLGVDCNREYFEQQQQGQEGGTSAPALHLRSSSAGASPDSDANIEVVAADFLDWELAQQFDVVVASHVLYQMPEDVLKRMLQKMLDCTRPGGYLVIMEAAPRGLSYQFISDLNPGHNTTTHNVVQALNTLGMPCRVFPIPSCVELENEEEVETVLRFIAVENCDQHVPAPEAVQEALQKYKPKVARDPMRGGYVLTEEADFILVHKSATRNSFWD